MSDEQSSQQEAEKNNELPESVPPEPIPVDEYTKENEQVADKLKEFGETDLEHFLSKVLSNQVYGKQAVRKLLGLDGEKPFINPEHHVSPQENNIVGKLDHSTYPPTLVGKDTTASTAVVQVDDAA